MLESILKSAPTGIGVVENRVIVQVNDYILELTGYTREELLGQSARMLYPTQKESDYVGSEKYRQISEKGTGSVETRWLRKDGTIRHVILSSTPLDPADLPAGVTFTVLDITDRKQAESALAERTRWFMAGAALLCLILLFLLIRLAAILKRLKTQADELESFFSLNLDLLCIADLEGNFVKTNKAWSQILGYSTEELNKRKFLEFVHPEDMQTTLDTMANLGTGNDVLNFTNRYRCKDGSYRYIEWRANPKGNLVYAAARDITGHKKAEETLRESEAKYRTIIDNSPVGYYIYSLDKDEQLVFKMFNPAADSIIRISHEQFIGRYLLDVFPALAGTPVPEMYRAVAKGEMEAQNFEIPYNYEDIRGVYEVRVFQGEPGQVVVNFTDISERNRLELINKTFENIIKRSRDFIGIANPGKNAFFVNPAGQAMVGLDSDDEVSKTVIEDYFLEEDLTFLKETILPDLFSKGRWIGEFRFRHFRTGDAIPVHYDLFLSEDPKTGELTNITTISRDITDFKLAEKKLADYRRILHDVIDTIPVRVFWKDLNARYLGCNKLFARDAGRTDPDSLIGEDDYSMGWTEQAELYRADDFQVMKRGIPRINYEELQTSPDGGTIWLRTSKIPLRDENGNIYGILGTYEDISELKQAEEKQLKLTEQLHQSQKMDAIGQLAGGIAHDFNNLIAGIIGFAELLLVKEKISENQKKYITNIITAADRAGNLTKKLLTFSHRGIKASSAIDCAKIISDTIEILKRTIDKNIDISFDNKAEAASIIGDDSMLQNAFLNISINAAHAMPDGGRLIFKIANISLDRNYCDLTPFDINPGEYVEITIKDTGTGMTQEVISRIFEPFFTTKEPGKGTGLGLTMVYAAVKEHSGAVNVYSKEGGGTVFNIYLPISGEVKSGKVSSGSLTQGSGTILLIDDEELMRISAAALLESIGYTVIQAENGREGIEIFENHYQEIDMTILDMIMPVMGGREVFRRLREIDPHIPVLIASGFAKEEDMISLKEQGICGFLQKPFRSAELAETVSKILSNKTARENLQ